MIVVLLVKYWPLSFWDKSPPYIWFLVIVYGLPLVISSQAMEDQSTHSVLLKGQSRTTYFTGGKMGHREFWWCVTEISEWDLKWGLSFLSKWQGGGKTVVVNADSGGSKVYHLRNLDCRDKQIFTSWHLSFLIYKKWKQEYLTCQDAVRVKRNIHEKDWCWVWLL